MTKTGHRITAATFAASLSVALLTGYVVPPYHQSLLTITVLWVIGIMLGASAPDWLEGVSRNSRGKEIGRLFKHRTFTHWIPLWLGAAWAIWHYQLLPWYGECLAFGFIASALLHIAVDSCSKAGIPLIWPYGKSRLKLATYRTGSFSEWVFAFIFVGGFAWLSVSMMRGVSF
jgi:membrane-bound metal-dependent hydrolase YbcI (DUF457 family)